MVTFSMSSNMFDFINVSGELSQAQLSEVSFVLRGQFPVLPASSYDTASIVQQLKIMVNNAVSDLESVLPFLVVIHSQLALNDRPRAVDFEDVCDRIGKLYNPYQGQPVSRLAVYLAMAYHSLYYVRLPKSPFAAASINTMNAVNKVMKALTRVELDHGCAQLVDGKYTGIAKLLKDFLNHWALWNDQRIARAAEAVLEKCDGSQRDLNSPRAMSSAISRLKPIELFPWLRAPDPDMPNLVHELADRGTKQQPRKTLENSFNTNLSKDCVLLNETTAFSFDSDTSTINIFIPRISRIPSILNEMSTLGVTGRSLKLNRRVFPLLDNSLTERAQFRLGKQAVALQCSVPIDPKTLEWDNASARVTESRIMPMTLKLPSRAASVLSSIDPLISDHELQLPAGNNTSSNAGLLDTDQSTDGGDTTEASLFSTQAQAAAGRIAGTYMKLRGIEAPFLVSLHGIESLSSTPGWHDRLNVDAYVPVSRPFDSCLALLVQRQLFRKPLPHYLANGLERKPLICKLRQTVVPNLELLNQLEMRDLQYWTLLDLQTHLQTSATFHIFRCILLESSKNRNGSRGQLIRAFCLDLGIPVDVFVPPHTDQVFAGDQVIGTEIMELDPLQGLFVVSM